MATEQEKLALRLRLERRRLPLTFFTRTAEDLKVLLRSIEEFRTGESAHVEWTIDADDLQLAAYPNGVPSEELQEYLTDAYDGIKATQTGEDIDWPGAIDARMQRTVQRLVGRIHRTTPASLEAVGHAPLMIEGEGLRYVPRQRERYAAWSSVDGKLDVISVRRVPYFVIFEHGANHRVRCLFPDEFMETVKNYLGFRVIAEGYVLYTRDGIPTRLTDPASLERVPEPSSQDIRAYRGSMPGITAGLSSYEYVRRLRDGE